jgi:ATP-dependent DNA ligase
MAGASVCSCRLRELAENKWCSSSRHRFASKVRAGLVPHVRRQCARSLKPLQISDCPFVDLPTEGSSRWGGDVSEEDMKEMIWTRPEMVVEIRFVEWTAESRLRLSKFLGMRPDKIAADVRREN